MADLLQDELSEMARESLELSRRHNDERRELERRRDELLIGAREAGMSNTKIVEALNAGCRHFLDELPAEPYTTQSVTALLRSARSTAPVQS